jgi:hypothetical protein
MTKAEWLTADDPVPMLEFLKGMASDRKLRLCAVACCRRAFAADVDEYARKIIGIAEAFADGLVKCEELREAGDSAHQHPFNTWRSEAPEVPLCLRSVCRPSAFAALFTCRRYVRMTVARRADRDSEERLTEDSAALVGDIRDIFGNPFRPVAFDPDWLTTDVRLLAEGIYAEKAFERMPVMADALQDAGCTSEELLAHLRSDGPHVRGCWALDLVLDKE